MMGWAAAAYGVVRGNTWRRVMRRGGVTDNGPKVYGFVGRGLRSAYFEDGGKLLRCYLVDTAEAAGASSFLDSLRYG